MEDPADHRVNMRDAAGLPMVQNALYDKAERSSLSASDLASCDAIREGCHAKAKPKCRICGRWPGNPMLSHPPPSGMVVSCCSYNSCSVDVLYF